MHAPAPYLLPRVSRPPLLSSCCILTPATLQGSNPRTSFSPLLLLHSQQSSAHELLPSCCILNLTGQLPPHVHTRHHAPTRRTPSLHTAPHGVPARNRRHGPCRVPPGGHLDGDGRETSCRWVWMFMAYLESTAPALPHTVGLQGERPERMCVGCVCTRCGKVLGGVGSAGINGAGLATYRRVTRGGFVHHPLHPPHPPHPHHLPCPTCSPCLSEGASLSIPPSLPPAACSP